MSTTFNLQIDAAHVLGVAADATLQQVRDAYRLKAKTYHPDAGGEEWAFRVLTQSYESLCTARVARAASREFGEAPDRPARTPPPASGSRPWASAARPASDSTSAPPFSPRQATPEPDRAGRIKGGPNETTRPGVAERSVDPSQVVNVEKLAIRFEAEHIWLITDRSNEHRFLSCCLNVSWPDAALGRPPSTVENADGICKGLTALIDDLAERSHATESRSAVLDLRFNGWLSYPTAEAANAAFALLRGLLHKDGLVVKQWSRDLIVPRVSA